MTENSDYYKMLKRMIKAGAKRTATADELDLREFVEVLDFFQDQVKEAVAGQRSEGKSWTDIGDALGITRQGAFKRFK
jgi:hypothetical protein